MNKVHELQKMTEEELLEYGVLIETTISSLLIESKSSSPIRSNQAGMRLDSWDKKQRELNDFLYKKG
ncbi:hypothetical protein AB4369_16390 [Vibrio sp. 10N.261.49.A5]|uniref:hypothetical protein n=1 Tax=Vibrio TaxID=662 RepID=UPI000D350D7F|nr:hypothetical protein [Vibrio splendidus]PTO71301.1 hypothetical protein CWN84_24795 [Vibrio splendidus]